MTPPAPELLMDTMRTPICAEKMVSRLAPAARAERHWIQLADHAGNA